MADVIRMSGLNSESFEKKTSRGEVPATSRGEVPATESSSRSGSRSGRAEVPIVGVKSVEHKGRAVRREAGTGVQSDSVESLAKKNCKRVRFDLREYGDGPYSQGGVAETEMSADTSRRSSEVLRRESRSGGSPSDDTTTIPSRILMQSKGNSLGSDPGRHAGSNSLLSPQRTEAAPSVRSIRGSGASSGNGTDIFVSHKWGHYEPVTDKPAPAQLPDKRARTQRSVNGDYLGRAHAAADDVDDDGDPDEPVPVPVGESDQEPAPETYDEAARDPRWVQSMVDEVNALKNRGVWRVVKVPNGGGVRLIKSKYVYRVKKNWAGQVIKRKSRLVVQGFSQREGIDYDETFAPVAKVTTFRLMLALSKVLNLQIHQLDVDSAFLYADLDEDVYVKPPPGMSIQSGYCLKLLKSLYGLKQAPRNWNKNIVDHIKSTGFKQCVLDNCLFVKTEGDETYLISLYVDDILIAGTDPGKIAEIKSEFTQRYEMKDLGELNYYLGMKVTRTADYIQLDQHRYTLDILSKYDHLLQEFANKKYATPMEKDLKLRKAEAESMSEQQRDYVERFPYQNIVGALLYLSINTRPDISYAVGVLARFCKNPNYRACKALLRVLIYLRGTAERGIRYTGDDLKVYAYSDADWAGDLDSRRSTTGYVVYAAGGPIAWQSKLQTTIAVSTMEAEYMAAFGAIQELIWTKGVMSELDFDYVGPMILHMDSQSAMALAKNPTHHKRSKHIDIKYHWLREHTYENGTVELVHCATGDMVADVMTKALDGPLHEKHAVNATGFGDV